MQFLSFKKENSIFNEKGIIEKDVIKFTIITNHIQPQFRAIKRELIIEYPRGRSRPLPLPKNLFEAFIQFFLFLYSLLK